MSRNRAISPELDITESGDITAAINAALATAGKDQGTVTLLVRNYGSAAAEIGAAATTNGRRAFTLAAGAYAVYPVSLYYPIPAASLYAHLAEGAALSIRVHAGV